MDDENCDESVYSVDKESIHVEHDYCRVEITCHSGEKKDHELGENASTEHAVEKWMDSPSVQVRADDDCNKCKVPASMGEVISRASTVLSVLTPNRLSQGREESSAETSRPETPVEPKESSEATSQSTSTSEYENPLSDHRRNAPDDSGMISQESELSDSITPDFEFLRDVPTQLQPTQHLTPLHSAPACRQTITTVPACDTSIHSQPTQILTGDRELPDFLRAFGSMLPSNFSKSSSPPPSLTPHYPSSDTRGAVGDPRTQCDNSNNASPPSLTPNYQSGDSERTLRADTSDSSEANVVTQYENSKCGSPRTFSNNGRDAVTDRSNTGRAFIDLETQCENSNSNGSQPLFLTQDSSPSVNQETTLTDTSDVRRAVIDLETQNENSNSGSPELSFIRHYPLSDKQGTSVTEFTSNRPCRSVFAPYPPRSPASRADNAIPSDTRQEVNDRDARYENSESNGSPPLFPDTPDTVIDLNSVLSQSATGNLDFSIIQRVIYGDTGYENSNRSKVTRLESTDMQPAIDRQVRYENSNCLQSMDMQRVTDRQIGYENSNCLELSGSTASITEFLGARCAVDSEDEPTQTRSPFRQDVHLVARKKQTPKRKRDEEPESLWTDEDYSQSGSPVLEIMSNNLGRLSKLSKPAADPCSISIGTNLSAPVFFNSSAQSPENVKLDNCHSERTRNSFAFRTLEPEGPESAAEGPREEAVEIQTVDEFTGSDTSNLRKLERKRVTIRKRKIDFCDSKENRPAKKPRVRDETPRRSTDSECPHSGRRRANLKVPRESDHSGAIELSEELLSNRCSEYDHIFPNVESVDDLAYEPIFLRHLVEQDYETVKQKIDVLVERIDALGEDL